MLEINKTITVTQCDDCPFESKGHYGTIHYCNHPNIKDNYKHLIIKSAYKIPDKCPLKKEGVKKTTTIKL